MATCGLLGSLACKLAGCQLQANKVVNSVDGDQLIWHSAFFSKTGFNMETGEDMYNAA